MALAATWSAIVGDERAFGYAGDRHEESQLFQGLTDLIRKAFGIIRNSA